MAGQIYTMYGNDGKSKNITEAQYNSLTDDQRSAITGAGGYITAGSITVLGNAPKSSSTNTIPSLPNPNPSSSSSSTSSLPVSNENGNLRQDSQGNLVTPGGVIDTPAKKTPSNTSTPTTPSTGNGSITLYGTEGRTKTMTYDEYNKLTPAQRQALANAGIYGMEGDKVILGQRPGNNQTSDGVDKPYSPEAQLWDQINKNDYNTHDTGDENLDRELNQLDKDRDVAVSKNIKDFVSNLAQFNKNKNYFTNGDELISLYDKVRADLGNSIVDGVIPEEAYKKIAQKYGISLEEAKDPNSIFAKRGQLTPEGKAQFGLNTYEDKIKDLQTTHDRNLEDLNTNLERLNKYTQAEIDQKILQNDRDVKWLEAYGAVNDLYRSGYGVGLNELKADFTKAIDLVKSKLGDANDDALKNINRLNEDFATNSERINDAYNRALEKAKTELGVNVADLQLTYGLGNDTLDREIEKTMNARQKSRIETIQAYKKAMSGNIDDMLKQLTLIEKVQALSEQATSANYKSYTENNGARLYQTTMNDILTDISSGNLSQSQGQTLIAAFKEGIYSALNSANLTSDQIQEIEELINQGLTPRDIISKITAKYPDLKSTENTSKPTWMSGPNGYILKGNDDGSYEWIAPPAGAQSNTSKIKETMVASKDKDGNPILIDLETKKTYDMYGNEMTEKKTALENPDATILDYVSEVYGLPTTSLAVQKEAKEIARRLGIEGADVSGTMENTLLTKLDKLDLEAMNTLLSREQTNSSNNGNSQVINWQALESRGNVSKQVGEYLDAYQATGKWGDEKKAAIEDYHDFWQTPGSLGTEVLKLANMASVVLPGDLRKTDQDIARLMSRVITILRESGKDSMSTTELINELRLWNSEADKVNPELSQKLIDILETANNMIPTGENGIRADAFRIVSDAIAKGDNEKAITFAENILEETAASSNRLGENYVTSLEYEKLNNQVTTAQKTIENYIYDTVMNSKEYESIKEKYEKDVKKGTASKLASGLMNWLSNQTGVGGELLEAEKQEINAVSALAFNNWIVKSLGVAQSSVEAARIYNIVPQMYDNPADLSRKMDVFLNDLYIQLNATRKISGLPVYTDKKQVNDPKAKTGLYIKPDINGYFSSKGY